MATAAETLKATLSETEYGVLVVLGKSATPLSGRKVAAALDVSPTTANDALGKLAEAGFVTSEKSGRATLWRLAVSHPSMSAWLEEVMPQATSSSVGSSPYSTGGGGVRLEHSYAACLVAGLLAGDPSTELGDSLSIDSIRLQASDTSEVDDILIEGTDAHGEVHRVSIAVRRSPALTKSDSASVPLIRDFLTVVTERWPAVAAGRWQLCLAVSSNANAITQLAELAALARSVPNGDEVEHRLAQPGRTSAAVRDRYEHIKSLVKQASEDLPTAAELGVAQLTWRLLSSLGVRTLRLERTDRADRTTAVNTLQRVLLDGTPATADALFSRIEELVGIWAPQAAVLTQSVIRRSLSDYPMSRSPRYAEAWAAIDRLSERLRDSIRPTLRAGAQSLELERSTERDRLHSAMQSVSAAPGALVVTGEPDVGKSAVTLRVAEAMKDDGAFVTSFSLRDIPSSASEFENQLGGYAIDDVLAAGEARPVRVLVIDGAESVLEGKGQMLKEVATSALKAGIGVVAITRTDGSRQVGRTLADSCELAGTDAVPEEHVIGPLAIDESEELTSTFPSLARLRGDIRTGWLLGRLGLVDVLLRTGEELDPADLLCEADVYSAVWRTVIRRDEVHNATLASPDDRESAALHVAKRNLGLPGERVPGTAAAELRSDGVLRIPNDAAVSVGDEFATDLFRDFALCRLLLSEGSDTLAAAGAPRWSIRATRLACQAQLLAPDRTKAWADLSTHFNAIAATHGDRWLEIPFEALLTLGDAERAVRELWTPLNADDGSSLATLLRLAEGRHVNGTIGDAFALAPLVSVAFCDRRPIATGHRFGHRDVHEVIRDLVLAWLRGAATSIAEPHSLRQAVRDTILSSDPPLYDDFAIEALATLGPDLDDRAESWLRAVLKDRPGHLNPAVESFAVALSMSQARPALLLDLAEAYYIELPDPEDLWGGGGMLDDGIRDFKHGLGPGFGVPSAAWYYGPFFRLLNALPLETIGFINRMLDHAARFRVQKLSSYNREEDHSDELDGVRLALPGIGERLYVGDGHVWAWYRGTSVGPYACMSALLALERFTDHLLQEIGLPARRIVELLLAECHNLAIPGLVVGLLTRHPKATGDLLDRFLISPAIWHLETARVTGDHGFRARDQDADQLTGSERRRFTFHEIVGEMVVNARLSGDDERLAQLATLGENLVQSARAELNDSNGDHHDYLALIESWAAEFRIENYRTSTNGDQVVIHFERPEPIERVLAPRNAELQTTSVLYGLQNRYGRFNDDPIEWTVEDLEGDLATARRIAESSDTPEGFLWPEDSLVSVAAAAVRAHAMGLATIEHSELIWAVEAVLWAAENPRIDLMSYHETTFPMGADRAAAAALPLVLLAPFDDLSLDRTRIEAALAALATSLFDEVRANFMRGCEPVWQVPCELGEGADTCRRHGLAWSAATEGLRDCRLGPWNQRTQQREPDPLPPPFSETLPAVADDALMVNRLRMPLACMVDARRVPCLREQADDLWGPLWDSYRRGVFEWWKEGYDHHAKTSHEPIAQRMIEITLDGDRDLLVPFIQALAADANALHLLFDGFATTFTYDEKLRARMGEFWPWALDVALNAVGDGSSLRPEHHWFDYMTAALLPTPSPHSWDPNIDATLARSRVDWIHPDALVGLDERWLQLARWEPKAVDAIIKFAKSVSIGWQTTTAFDWIEAVIDERYDLISNRLYYLEEWLSELRKEGMIASEVKSQYHRIIDGLAAAGDRAAVRLQQLDE